MIPREWTLWILANGRCWRRATASASVVGSRAMAALAVGVLVGNT
jgi:hypothetical protein